MDVVCGTLVRRFGSRSSPGLFGPFANGNCKNLIPEVNVLVTKFKMKEQPTAPRENFRSK